MINFICYSICMPSAVQCPFYYVYTVCKMNKGLAVSPSVYSFMYVKSQRQAVTERKYNFLNGSPLRTNILKITNLCVEVPRSVIYMGGMKFLNLEYIFSQNTYTVYITWHNRSKPELWSQNSRQLLRSGT
jgi:hypothetical protein